MKNPTNIKKEIKPFVKIEESGDYILIWASGRLVATITHEDAKVLYEYLQAKYSRLTEEQIVRPSER